MTSKAKFKDLDDTWSQVQGPRNILFKVWGPKWQPLLSSETAGEFFSPNYPGEVGGLDHNEWTRTATHSHATVASRDARAAAGPPLYRDRVPDAGRPRTAAREQPAACAYLPADCSRLMIRARAQEYKS
jgi:hypothetical protein